MQQSFEHFIAEEKYFTTHSEEYWGDKGQTTICILKLTSGYEIVGAAGTITPENYDPEIGKRIARENAITELRSNYAFHYQMSRFMYENLNKLMEFNTEEEE